MERIQFKLADGRLVTVPSETAFLPMFKEEFRVRVHGGKMHADEIVGIALLRLIFGNRIRVVDLPEDNIDLSIDCGNAVTPTILDHHQENAAIRDYDGNKHSACGLVFEVYKSALFLSRGITDAKEQRELTYRFRSMLREFEDADNGVSYSSSQISLVSMLAYFNVSPNATDQERLASFNHAVNIMQALLERFLIGSLVSIRAYDRTREALLEKDEDARWVDVKVVCPWKEVFKKETFLFDGVELVTWAQLRENQIQFYIQSVPESPDDMYSMRCQTPKEWRGKRNEELKAIDPDLIFCHAAGFLTVTSTSEGRDRIMRKLLAGE